MPATSHSRTSSNTSARHAHTPQTPSQLRNAHVPSEGSASPDDKMHKMPSHDLEFSTDGIHPAPDHTSVHSNNENAAPEHPGGILEIDLESTAHTELLNNQDWDASSGYGGVHDNHGPASRPVLHRNYGSFNTIDEFGGRYPGIMETAGGEVPDETHALLGDAFADGVLGGVSGQKMSTTQFLAERHGVRHKRMM